MEEFFYKKWGAEDWKGEIEAKKGVNKYSFFPKMSFKLMHQNSTIKMPK